MTQLRKLTRSLAGATVAMAVLAAGATAVSADTYMRKGSQAITVAVKGGKLYCTRASDGFEMCNGMAKSGGGYSGSGMKHPDMPGFMTFNGTVTMAGNSLTIKGCAIGQSMCDSETWTKK